MNDQLTGDEMHDSTENNTENIVALHPEAGIDKTLAVEEASQYALETVAEELEILPSNVELLNCTTKHDIPVDRILQGAKEAGLEEVVVVGFTKDGEEYLASSTASIQSTLYNLARGLHHTQRTCDECFTLSSNVRPAE